MFRVMIVLSAALMSATIHAHKRFILTGGPCVGKSTIISLLNMQGYQTTPETFQKLYTAFGIHAIESMGWLAFRDILMRYQIQAEDSLNHDEPAFLDRSALDIIFFWHYYQLPFSVNIINATAKRSYRAILFLEELPKELYVQSASRQESPEQAHIMHESLRSWYQAKAAILDIPFISIPFASPQERISMIKKHLAFQS